MRQCFRSLAVIALSSTALVLIGVLPFPAGAQPNSSPHRVGVLNDARAANHPTVDGLKAGLRNLGLEEGRDVLFDVRLTDGNPEQMSAAAGALVRAGVDVIFASGEVASLAAKAATQTLPIVFTLVGDPVETGIVTSLARPGGNLTGISSLTTMLVLKRLEVLKALAPRLRRVWAVDHGADPASRAAIIRVLASSSRFGVEVVVRTVRTPDELKRTLESVGSGDALLVPDIANDRACFRRDSGTAPGSLQTAPGPRRATPYSTVSS
jgi:putative ABC transport system substrate-binding protein